MIKAIKILIFILALTFWIGEAYAARIVIESPQNEIGLTQEFLVDVTFDTEGNTFNAIEGQIVFSPEIKVKEIWYGGSVVSAWLNKPKLSDDNKIDLSGIIQGGFTGVGNLISFSLVGERAGLGVIESQGISAFLHTQKGGKVSIPNIKTTVSINQNTPILDNEIPEDTNPPLPFFVEVVPGEDEGTFFAIFSTRDLESGIDHYEFLESDGGLSNRKLRISTGWKIVESPALLSSGAQSKFVYIKAVDQAGNEAYSAISPEGEQITPKPAKSADKVFIYLGLIGIIIVIINYARKYRKNEA